jgi:hypothetical protein
MGDTPCMTTQRREGQQGREYWTAKVAEFGGSGQTQREYCEQRGLKFSVFRNWLYSLRREAPGRSKPGKSSGRFVQVVPSAPKPIVVCKLQVGRAEMLFSELPPAAYVGELLRLMDR